MTNREIQSDDKGYGKLWSLDGMMRFTAAGLFTSLLWLNHVNTDAVGNSLSDKELREKYRAGLKEVRIDAERCRLTPIVEKIDHLLSTWLNEEKEPDMNIAVAMVSTFVGDVQRELKEHLYFRIAKEERVFYEQLQLSEAASAAFPSTITEIRNAGKCFALDQPTASVLHSMRALEVPLQAMVTELKFTPSSPNWQNIINECEREIRKITDKNEQEFYSGAAANFMHIKNAWRNHAVHGRDTYDKDQAYEILSHVVIFMKQLAKRIAGPGGTILQ